MENMKNKIHVVYEEMMKELEAGIAKDNRSAYRRARLASVNLDKLLKEFRKESPK